MGIYEPCLGLEFLENREKKFLKMMIIKNLEDHDFPLYPRIFS